MKKLLIYVLTLVAAFVLVGCGGAKPAEPGKSETPEGQPPSLSRHK